MGLAQKEGPEQDDRHRPPIHGPAVNKGQEQPQQHETDPHAIGLEALYPGGRDFFDGLAIRADLSPCVHLGVAERAGLEVGCGLRHHVTDPLRELRKAQGYSQEGFALTVELDQTYISGIERGERKPGLKTILKIAEALGVPVRICSEVDDLTASQCSLRCPKSTHFLIEFCTEHRRYCRKYGGSH